MGLSEGPTQSLTLWIGALIMALPLVGLLFLAVVRWRCSPQQRDDRRIPDDMQLGGLAEVGRTVVRDIGALECAVPSCRPRKIEHNSEQDCAFRPTCSVCLVDFEVGDDARQLPCSHIIHVQCIDGWLARRWACPLCRRELPNPTSPQPTVSATSDGLQRSDSGELGGIVQMTV